MQRLRGKNVCFKFRKSPTVGLQCRTHMEGGRWMREENEAGGSRLEDLECGPGHLNTERSRL